MASKAIIICSYCKKKFNKYKYRITKNNFCSHRCVGLFQRGKPINLNHKNGQWKGEKVKYHALHTWVKARKPKTKLCENCKKVPPRDLANKGHTYKRNIKDYMWLCRSCHNSFDREKKEIKITCPQCNIKFTKFKGRETKYCSMGCYKKQDRGI